MSEPVARERFYVDVERKYFYIKRGEVSAEWVLAGVAEVFIWLDGVGKVAKLEVEFLDSYEDESRTRKFLAEMKW